MMWGRQFIMLSDHSLILNLILNQWLKSVLLWIAQSFIFIDFCLKSSYHYGCSIVMKCILSWSCNVGLIETEFYVKWIDKKMTSLTCLVLNQVTVSNASHWQEIGQLPLLDIEKTILVF